MRVKEEQDLLCVCLWWTAVGQDSLWWTAVRQDSLWWTAVGQDSLWWTAVGQDSLWWTAVRQDSLWCCWEPFWWSAELLWGAEEL